MEWNEIRDPCDECPLYTNDPGIDRRALRMHCGDVES